MQIAVISDIHGAAQPFAKALQAARREGYDQLILLGDILTYGVEPAACLDLAGDAISSHGAILVGGNHDQLYVDLAREQSTYFDTLPEWIGESVRWTMQQTGGWPASLGWQEEWVIDDALFAHANPFAYGDWTYLSDLERMERATTVLADRGLRWGVFGHLHRPQSYCGPKATAHVVGSIGQPRSREHPAPQWSMIQFRPGRLSIEHRSVDFDPVGHCAAIQQTTELTQATRDMLCRYFT